MRDTSLDILMPQGNTWWYFIRNVFPVIIHFLIIGDSRAYTYFIFSHQWRNILKLSKFLFTRSCFVFFPNYTGDKTMSAEMILFILFTWPKLLFPLNMYFSSLLILGKYTEALKSYPMPCYSPKASDSTSEADTFEKHPEQPLKLVGHFASPPK